jgi:hypothetical protein
MKRLSGFIMGVITTVILLVLFVPSLASSTLQTIEVGMNAVNLSIDGNIVSKIGEGYVREGTESEICSSISFQGTTFIPIRRVSEILGINVEYDNNTKTVLLTTNNYKLGKDTEKSNNMNIDITPTNITNYEDFKSMWTIEYNTYTSKNEMVNYAIYRGSLNSNEFIEMWNNINENDIIKYSQELVKEKWEYNYVGKELTITFAWKDGLLGTATCDKNGNTSSEFNKNITVNN